MSSRRIEDLMPEMQEKYAEFKAKCEEKGLDFIVTCTTRTEQEQKELVRIGRSKTMKSKHLEGKAFDIAVMKDGKPVWDAKAYLPYGEIGQSIGLIWGGDWRGFPDSPHFELKEA